MPFTPIDSKNYGVEFLQTSGLKFYSTIGGSTLTFRSADLANIRGGKVARATAVGEVGLYAGTTDAALTPLGLFYGNPDDQPNEATVVSGHGVIALVDPSGWDVGATLASFALGAEVIATNAGLLKFRAGGETTQKTVGIVTKTPTSVTDTLGIKLLV